MSSLTYKIIDAINDLTNEGSTGDQGSGSTGDQGSGSTGVSITGGFHYFKYSVPGNVQHPAYVTLCKATQGSFFDGYIYWVEEMVHVKVTVESESKVYGYVLSPRGPNPPTYKWKLITHDGQKYVGLEYTNMLDFMDGSFYMINVMCSSTDDIKSFSYTNQPESKSDLTIDSSIDIVLPSA